MHSEESCDKCGREAMSLILVSEKWLCNECAKEVLASEALRTDRAGESRIGEASVQKQPLSSNARSN